MFEATRSATESFWEFLSEIAVLPLLAAIACHVVKLGCTSRAWRNILAAAYPSQRVAWKQIFAAYVSGVGINAIVPARGGDVVRVVLAHRAIPGSSYTTIVSSTVVLTFVDMALASIVFVWALTQGVLPSLDVLPDLPAFDYSWAIEDGVVSPVAAIIVFAAIVAAIWLLQHSWSQLRPRIEQAFAVFDPPTRWARTVLVWQLADWGLRFATIWFFLGAFGIEQSVRNAILVQATASLSTLVPATPGGIGTEQALLVYAFRDAAIARSTLLAFSVGMKLTLTVVNVVVGFGTLFLTLGTFRYGELAKPPPSAADPPTGTT